MANTHSIALVSSSSQYLRAADSASLSITGDITIEAWVKFSSLPGTNASMYILDKWTGGALSYLFCLNDESGTKYLNFTFSPNNSNAYEIKRTWTPSTDTWYHVAISFTASTGTGKLFVDGSQLGADVTVAGTSIYNSTAYLWIGADDGSQNFFNGKIDDIRIWAEARSGATIASNMSTELTGSETNLKAYWKLDNALTDSTSNGNTLTAYGSPKFSIDLPFDDGDTSTLRTSLISWFDLESDGTDSHGSNTLSTNTNNLFGSSYGKVGNGAYGNSNDANHSVLKKASASDVAFGTGSFSFACWFNLQGSGHANTFQPPLIAITTSGSVAKRAILSIRPSDGNITVDVWDGSAGFSGLTYATGITSAGWHFISLVRNGNSNIQVYVDDLLVYTSGSLSTCDLSNLADLYLFGDYDTNDEFCGYLDSVGIWGKALNGTELNALYNAGTGLNYSGTSAVVAPTVTTSACSSVLPTSATGNGNITDTGGENCTRRGFCYLQGSSGDPTTADSVAYDDGDYSTGAYTKSITGLSASTQYRVRAYAVNSAGTGYGSTVDLTTTDLVTITAAVGSFTLTGNASGFTKYLGMVAALGEFTLTGFDIITKSIKGIIASTGSFVLTGYDMLFTKYLKMLAVYGEFVLTGFDAGLNRAWSIIASSGSFVITGYDVLFTKYLKMVAATGEFVLTGMDAIIGKLFTMVAETGAFVLTGYTTAYTKYLKMVAAVGAFVETGYDMMFTKYLKMVASTGSFVLTGVNVLFTKLLTLSLSVGSFVLTGFDTTLGKFITARSNVSRKKMLRAGSFFKMRFK